MIGEKYQGADPDLFWRPLVISVPLSFGGFAIEPARALQPIAPRLKTFVAAIGRPPYCHADIVAGFPLHFGRYGFERSNDHDQVVHGGGIFVAADVGWLLA